MADWIEYIDVHAVEMLRGRLVNVQAVAAGEGIEIEFGNNPSKRGSRDHFKLKAVLFDKELWTPEMAEDWWKGHLIKFVPREKLGMKVPKYDFFLDLSSDLGIYVVACLRDAPKKPFKSILSEHKET